MWLRRSTPGRLQASPSGMATSSDGTISTIWPTCSAWSRTGIHTDCLDRRSAQLMQTRYAARSSGSFLMAMCTGRPVRQPNRGK